MTPSQTVGPFFTVALRSGALRGDPLRCGPVRGVAPRDPTAVRVTGRVLDGAGDPVPDALVESWQSAPDSFARCPTDTAGRWSLVTARPGALPTPDGRMEAPHLDLSVFARGLLHRVVTRLYFADERQANAADPVLTALPPAAAATLVAAARTGNFHLDIHLQGPHETVFFAV